MLPLKQRALATECSDSTPHYHLPLTSAPSLTSSLADNLQVWPSSHPSSRNLKSGPSLLLLITCMTVTSTPL